jgi:glycosyltransferase involved in cell wall biosynthesis
MSTLPAPRAATVSSEQLAAHVLALDTPRIAVLIPCHNEEASIEKVVRDFAAALPEATIYVCDNRSTDQTAARAAAAGAAVSYERLPGKGNAVRRMFADVEADIYVLADGDDTYDHDSAPVLIRRLREEGLDMVVAARVASSEGAYRPGHRLGNYVLTKLVRVVFGDRITDMLSGYRVFSRRFVKSFPALAAGFEIETELTVHALELRMPIDEMPTPYRERPPNSTSKLRTYSDGWRILKTIVWLVKEERPLQFFGLTFGALTLTSIVLAIPLLVTYLETGLVPRLPTAILASALMLLAFLSLACGAILDTVTRGRRELKRLYYLSVRGVNPRTRRGDA